MTTLPPITQLAGPNGALFDGYWAMLDGSQKGHIDAGTSAAFLKKSQLREPVLHKIWDCSDPNGRGYLDKQGFFMALRLVSAAQCGKEVSAASLALSDPVPKLVGVDPPPPTSTPQPVSWIIEPEEQSKFEKIFQSAFPGCTLLSGDKAKPMMLASKLPVDTLSKIWNLADIDQDGNLDKDEFGVAMRLIQVAQAGETLPVKLPASIIPFSKTSPSSSSSSSLLKPSGSGAMLSSIAAGSLTTSTSAPGSPAPSKKLVATPPTDWVVTPEVKAKYDSYFQGIDKDHDGLVTGEEARGLFMASNLQQNTLAHIWNLCDLENVGKLNAEQFALAMFLIAEKVRGKGAPTELAPNMIPPSLRKQQAPPLLPTSSSSSSLAPLSSSWTTPTSTMATTAWTLPTTSSMTFPSASATATVQTALFDLKETPTDGASGSSAAVNGTAAPSAGGFDTDFSAIMELDNISNEIEGIRKEKTQLQDEFRQKQELVQQRKGEIERLQAEVSMVTRQKEELERQKNESQKQLDELDSEKAKFEGQIAELKQNCKDEREETERLKRTVSEQESSTRTQTEEIEGLKRELEKLRFEEKEYRVKVDANKVELETLQKSNQHIQSDITQVRNRIDGLKEEHHTLSHQLMLYPQISTPGSTPSSSVININDVGRLPAELHIPHISEPDAISARATAGSSSPVSSISGFSTNSHLEDTGDDGSSNRGGDDRTQTIKADPFGSTHSSSSAADPFAAFSLPPGSESLFSGGSLFSGKPSDLSAFDPFGPSDADPFKSTGPAITSSMSGEDLFKTDPFASSAPATSGTSPTPLVSSGSAAAGGGGGGGGGGSTDPFSGQDPFSSDPFASTKPDTTQSPWGGASPFAVDPFSSSQATAETPTDLFASDYSFGDDSFGSSKPSASGGGAASSSGVGNPFSSSGGGFGSISSTSAASPAHAAGNERDQVSWAKKESKKDDAVRKRQLQKEEEELARALKESLKSL